MYCNIHYCNIHYCNIYYCNIQYYNITRYEKNDIAKAISQRRRPSNIGRAKDSTGHHETCARPTTWRRPPGGTPRSRMGHRMCHDGA